MKKTIICTVCPMGCRIHVEGEIDNIATIEGYGCKRGLEYGNTEFSHPVRILTTTVKTADSNYPLLPVRSNAPLPKEKIMACMSEIRVIQVTKPVKCGEVILKNICNTAIDIIATGSIE